MNCKGPLQLDGKSAFFGAEEGHLYNNERLRGPFRVPISGAKKPHLPRGTHHISDKFTVLSL
jgi:hypothetical protein